MDSVEPWILDAIDMFEPVSMEDLTYVESSGSQIGYFTADLSREAKNIISQIMVLPWLRKEVQNVLQFSNFITDRDMKSFSAAQNLKAKQDFLIVKMEEIDKLLSDYAYRKAVNWSDWNNQNFITLV